MKKLLTAALLAALIAVFPLSGAIAFAAEPFSNPTYTLTAGDGFSYKESVVTDSGGTQAMFLGEYKSSAESEYEYVIHSIRNGSKTTLTTVMDIAKDYEETTGRKVIFATNGDYFDFGSGSNMESYVNDGVVISKGSYISKHCIGFDNDGKVAVGRMTQTQRRLLVEKDGEKRFFEIDKTNEAPLDGEIAVYTKAGTFKADGAGKYILNTESVNLSQLPVWGTSKRTSTGTVANDDEFTVKSNQFAVVVKGENAQYFFDNVKYGVSCSIVEIPDGDFAGCNWVLGGYDILVNAGEVNTKCHTDNDGNGYAPRTFIGFKQDGTAFLCVVDGRQGSYSKGITVTREATLAKELGAYDALELDGGGSSTVILRVNDELTLRNKPSDGQMRKVSNAIMLVEKAKAAEGGDTTETPSDTNTENPPAATPGNDNTGLSCGSTTDCGTLILPLPFIAAAAVILTKKMKRSEK